MEHQGNIEQRTHVSSKSEKVATIAGEEGAFEDDVARCERMRGHFHFDEHEECEQGNGEAESDDGDFRAPGYVAAVVEADEEVEHGCY